MEIIAGLGCAELLLSLGLPVEEVVRTLMGEVGLSHDEACTAVSAVRERTPAAAHQAAPAT